MKRLAIAIIILLISISAWGASQQTSSTLASTMITNARYYLDEATEDYWSDTELLGWLNDGVVDIAAKTNCLETTEAVTLTASTVEYTISTAYITIKDVVYNGTSYKKGLIKGNVRSIGHEMQDDEPTYWYEFAGKVGIYPALTSVTTETATLYLIKRPTAIASSAAVTTPAIYDKALVYYIVAQAQLKQGQGATASAYLSLYQAELDRYRADFVDQAQQAKEPVR